jgi:hypothetical protein
MAVLTRMAAMEEPLEAEVLESTVVDEAVLLRLLRRAGRGLARPALDLIPDLLPVIGFSDDLVALTALLGILGRYRSPVIRQRAQRRLDRWFPLGR